MAPIRNNFLTPKRRPSNEVPKKNEHPKPVENFDHHDGILRKSFRLNDSASKVLSIYLDPSKDFEPIIHIGKPGQGGIKLNMPQFTDLVVLQNQVSEFFASDVKEAMTETKHGVSVKLTSGWLKPVMKIAIDCADIEETKCFVVLAHSTYKHIVKFGTLYRYAFDEIEGDVVLTRQIYGKMLDMIKNLGIKKYAAASVVQDALLSLGDPELFDPTFPEPLITQTRMFYELLSMCAEKMSRAL